MAEPVLSFRAAQHRHALHRPTLFKPWATQPGPGIHHLDLDLHEGAVLGIVGPNGAGKTTLLRLIAGVLPLQSGSVRIRHRGEHVSEVEDLRRWVGHMPEQVRWQGRATVLDTLESLADMRGLDAPNIRTLLNVVGLGQRQNEPLDNLSQGMRQRLSIAAALLGSPKVLVLDEPFNGLDPVAAKAFASLIQTLAKKGVSIVISSHMVAHLEGLIDRIALLHRGQLLDEGPLGEVEERLGLSGRSVLVGSGIFEARDLLEAEALETVALVEETDQWTLTVQGNASDIVNTLLQRGHVITSWSPVKPDLVEWLCAATGMPLDHISLEVASSALIPMQSVEVGEDE